MLKDGATAEDKYTTGRMRQQKKKILHKLCIDMERSEYTSYEVKRVGTALQYLLFLRPLFDQYIFTIAAVSVQ